MGDYLWVVRNWKSEGSTDQKISRMVVALGEFVQQMRPVLEHVQANHVNWFGRKFTEIRGLDLENAMRADRDDADKCLAIYNRTFGTLDINLGMLKSNFGLREFLRESGIPDDALPAVSEEIRAFWERSYGDLIGSLGTIKDHLARMRALLQRQIDLHDAMDNVPFYKGFELSKEFRECFEEERKAFYLVDRELRAALEGTGKAEALLKSELERARSALRAHADMVRWSHDERRESVRSELEKNIVSALFVVKISCSLLRLRRQVVSRGIMKAVTSLLVPRLLRKHETIGEMLAEILGILIESEGDMAGSALAGKFNAYAKAL